MIQAIHLVLVALYGAGAAGHIFRFLRDGGRASWAVWLLRVGALVHIGWLALLWRRFDRAPFASVPEAAAFCAFLLVLGYFYVERSDPERPLGAVIAPLILLLVAFGALVRPGVGTAEPSLSGGLYVGHVVLTLIGYSALAVSFAGSTLYVLLSRELKRKRPGFFYARLPSLEALDHINDRAVVVGYTGLTLGITLGSLWAWRVWGEFFPWDPKHISALITWLIYTVALLVRVQAGWRGKRVAWLSVAGFAMVVSTFAGVKGMGSSFHAF